MVKLSVNLLNILGSKQNTLLLEIKKGSQQGSQNLDTI